MSKILVTGAKGLLGTSLVINLKKHNYDVIEHSRSQNADVDTDLSDFTQVCSLLDQKRPDYVINLAALTNVDECEKHPNKAYQANVLIVENISNWIHKTNNSCHLIHISTDQVYDGKGADKEENISLTNYYAFSKYASELAVKHIPCTVLRTNFFGPSQCKERTSISDWLIESLSNKKTITVFDDVYFSPLSIDSLIKMIIAVVMKPRAGIYNLGSKKGLSKAEFAFELAKVMELPVDYVTRGTSKDVKLLACRPKDMRMDSSKFEKDFEVVLPTLLQEIQSMKGAYSHETR